MQLNLFAAFQLFRNYRWLVLQKLPMIRWSLEKKFSNNSYWPPDDHINKILQTFSQNYRWSNDNFSVFLLNSTNDPTITFLFVCRTLPMIRRSQSVFLLNTTDDPTITNWFLLMIRRPSSTIRRSSLPALLDPTIIKYFSQQKYYRWSDDQKKSFYLWSSDHPS